MWEKIKKNKILIVIAAVLLILVFSKIRIETPEQYYGNTETEPSGETVTSLEGGFAENQTTKESTLNETTTRPTETTGEPSTTMPPATTSQPETTVPPTVAQSTIAPPTTPPMETTVPPTTTVQPSTSKQPTTMEQSTTSKPPETTVSAVGFVTITIRCDSVFRHYDLLDVSLKGEGMLPADGMMLSKEQYPIYKGDTVFDVLVRATKAHRIPLDYQGASGSLYHTVYIEGIMHLYEFSCGPQSGWVYTVNGIYANKGCSDYDVQDGDDILWYYTCELGEKIE